jgi:hypothetical protein
VLEFESTFNNIAQVGCTFDMLRGRFDNLPVHLLCFNHLHQSMAHNNIYELLREMVQLPTANGDKVDCLGMTPLHVIACLGARELSLYRCLVDNYPESMITKDKLGDIPVFYVLLSEPPLKIIHYFVEMEKVGNATGRFW